jgi:predicted metal-dependent hydrolase
MPIPVRTISAVPGRFEIATESGYLPVDIRRHPRARSYTLRVAGPGKPPILTMPERGTLAEAHRFLERHAGWLRRQIERLPPAIPIADGWPVPLRGELHTIHHDPARRGPVTVGMDDNGPALYVSGGATHLRRRVLDFLKREARRDIEAAVARHAERLSVTPRSVRCRDQITRWGSCTTTGHLSFSWRLIMAPPLVLDYLAAHEVAHLAEMSHSRRFWQLCKSLSPGTEIARAWLAAQGPALHAIGADAEATADAA